MSVPPTQRGTSTGPGTDGEDTIVCESAKAAGKWVGAVAHFATFDRVTKETQASRGRPAQFARAEATSLKNECNRLRTAEANATTVTRRRCLSLLTGMSLGLGALMGAPWSVFPEEYHSDESFGLAGGSARRVGFAYLRDHPREARATLRDPALRRRESFARQCELDYREGRTVILHGWLLSRTECRLCALVALS
jgi:hypothetical protein